MSSLGIRDRVPFPKNLRTLQVLVAVCSMLLLIPVSLDAWGQQTRRKPVRSSPPKLDPREFDGVFFDDVQKQLVGTPPDFRSDQRMAVEKSSSPATNDSTSTAETSEGQVWKERISDQSIEDLVKEAKRRLDSVVTTPARFAAGGFQDARKEFSLLALMFAVIEQYPGQVRWKNSASMARSRFARMAANAKVGSQPAFNEAKLRLEDLDTLLKGGRLNESSPISEFEWSEIIDRGPSMQLLEWALREHLVKHVASEAAFRSESEEVMKYAELIAVVGETLHQEGMWDADDDEYVSWSKKMVEEAQRVVDAVKLNNASLAREAVGQVDQACNACHNTFR